MGNKTPSLRRSLTRSLSRSQQQQEQQNSIVKDGENGGTTDESIEKSAESLPAHATATHHGEVLHTIEINKSRLHIVHGSIIDFEGQVLVNAANEGGVNGGGVDGAINVAGGPELLAARRAIPAIPGSNGKRIPKGTAVITDAFGKLKVQKIIHATGPNYITMLRNGHSPEECDKILMQAYGSVFRLVDELKFSKIGVTFLCAGVFRGPRELSDILGIGLAAGKTYLEQCESETELNYFCYSSEEADAVQVAVQKHFTDAS